MSILMNGITGIFEFSNRLVEVIGGVFAALINFLIDLAGLFCSWLVDVIANSGELQGPITFVLIILGIAVLVALIWYSPYLLAITFILIPLLIWLLKMTLGWLILFGIARFIYKKVKKAILWLFKQVKRPAASVE